MLSILLNDYSICLISGHTDLAALCPGHLAALRAGQGAGAREAEGGAGRPRHRGAGAHRHPPALLLGRTPTLSLWDLRIENVVKSEFLGCIRVSNPD